MMLSKKAEHAAWRDVTAAGVKVPTELAEMWAQAEDLAAQRDEVAGQAAEVVPAPSAILAGASVVDAVDAEREAAHATELAKARQSAAGQAVRLLDERVARWVVEHRDELIGECLRPVVDDIVTTAAALAAKLERFAPGGFDADEVAKWGKPGELQAWRTARELQERLVLCLDAWFASWKVATSTVESNGRLPGYLRPDAPGGVHAWQHPEAIDDADVRDGRCLDVLRIAAHAEAGYRLATGAEMVELSERFVLASTWVAGEQTPRQVFHVTGPRQDRQPEPQRSGRAVFQ